MSSRKTTLFYAVLLSVASLAVGMVIASRLELTPASSAQSVSIPSRNSAPLTGAIDMSTFRNIAKAAEPMVVNIRTESKQRAQDMTDLFGGDDMLRRFFPGPDDQPQQRQPREQVAVAAGTGFIINGKDGLILTNNHVVEGATKIEVSLFGDEDQVYKAKIVGRDKLTDSALIQLTEKPNRPLSQAKFGDSSVMEPGDWVMAIGNPFGLAHTVSVGVISAVKRPFPVADGRSQDVLQTDAAINPGNSGGPLLNLRGEVVGINTAIISNDRSAGNVGIGFAIPINTVADLLDQLGTGKVTRGRIGVQVAPISADALEEFGLKERKGALVSQVSPSSAAAKAGVQPGDVIVEFKGQQVMNRDDLVRMVVATKPGTTVPMKVVRKRQEKTLNITVDELDLEAESTSLNPDSGADAASTGFGMTMTNLTPELGRRLRLPAGSSGALITEVDPAGPAARSGIAAGDVILEVNHQPVASASEAGRALQSVESGRSALILLFRRGQEVFVTVKKD